jgi:hypothetical protein
MSTLAREDLLWRFGKVEDPEIEARRQRILEVLLEASPQTKQQLIEQGLEQGLEQGQLAGQLIATRDSLRQVLVHRQLTPSQDEDARIEACTDIATLKRWLDRAFTAASVSDALR